MERAGNFVENASGSEFGGAVGRGAGLFSLLGALVENGSITLGGTGLDWRTDKLAQSAAGLDSGWGRRDECSRQVRSMVVAWRLRVTCRRASSLVIPFIGWRNGFPAGDERFSACAEPRHACLLHWSPYLAWRNPSFCADGASRESRLSLWR